jgi:hypothetical protein
MKRPIFLISFFSMKRDGSKCLISPAIRQLKAAASNDSIRVIPQHPSISDCHVCAVVSPIAVSSPTPVTTTLREMDGLL